MARNNIRFSEEEFFKASEEFRKAMEEIYNRKPPNWTDDIFYDHGTSSGRWSSGQPNMQEIPNNRVNGETIKSNGYQWKAPIKEVRLQTPDWMLKRLLEKLGDPIEFEEI